MWGNKKLKNDEYRKPKRKKIRFEEKNHSNVSQWGADEELTKKNKFELKNY